MYGYKEGKLWMSVKERIVWLLKYMERLNRDLIILGRIDKLDQNIIKQEILSLNALLNFAEMSDERYKTFELMDLNKFKLRQESHIISKALKSAIQAPFQFLINKN